MRFAATRLVASGCGIGFAKALAVTRRVAGEYEIGACLMAEVLLATVDLVDEAVVVAASG